jgi:hypothetical protein
VDTKENLERELSNALNYLDDAKKKKEKDSKEKRKLEKQVKFQGNFNC